MWLQRRRPLGKRRIRLLRLADAKYDAQDGETKKIIL